MRIKNYLTIFLISFLLSSSCKKENDEPTLPPETTTGAMTFGCKVNGKVFVPKDGNGNPGLYVQYVYLGNGPGGGWYLNIPATNWKDSNLPSMGIETDSLLLLEGNSYALTKKKGFAFASYSYGSSQFNMLLTDTGQLYITKHDQMQRILSGTFSFAATSSGGEKVNITEGRFDVRY